MKVWTLRAMLEGVPDDLDVLIDGGYDHQYTTTHGAGVVDAETIDGSEFWEYYDDENMFTDGAKVRVFLIEQ